MPAASRLNSLYLRYFSKPSHERTLYRAIRKHRPTSIVEIGIGDGQRAARMVRLAQRYAGEATVSYAGMDLFEERPAYAPGLTLKQAHRLLTTTAARVRLVPGDPFSAMARTANSLVGSHLLVVAAECDEESLSRAWFYVPRILTQDSLVFVERLASSEHPKAGYQRLTLLEVQQLAAPTRRRAA